jgi:hypothetical protein
MEMKIVGSGPVASNRERGLGSLWSAAPAEKEEEISEKH